MSRNIGLKELSAKWLECKHQEQLAIDERRYIEDQMQSLIGLPVNHEGVETVNPDGYIVKVTGRIDRKVNGEKVQEIAAEHGLTEHLSTLFRWTPAINAKAWKATSSDITNILADAITAKPARPTYKIIQTEE